MAFPGDSAKGFVEYESVRAAIDMTFESVCGPRNWKQLSHQFARELVPDNTATAAEELADIICRVPSSFAPADDHIESAAIVEEYRHDSFHSLQVGPS